MGSGLGLLLLLSCPVMSGSLWPYGLHHARPPCQSPSPKVCPSSCPLHQWCHSAISSSDTLFSFCPQSLPVSGPFPMSRLFASDVRNTGVSASAWVLPMSIWGWFPSRLTDSISLLSKGLSGIFSSTTVQRIACIHIPVSSLSWTILGKSFRFFVTVLSAIKWDSNRTIA